MATAKVTSKGQVTIPVEVRRRLGIEPGTRIDFVWHEAGRYELSVVSSSIRDLKGTVPSVGRAVTVEEMNEAIATAATGEADG